MGSDLDVQIDQASLGKKLGGLLLVIYLYKDFSGSLFFRFVRLSNDAFEELCNQENRL